MKSDKHARSLFSNIISIIYSKGNRQYRVGLTKNEGSTVLYSVGLRSTFSRGLSVRWKPSHETELLKLLKVSGVFLPNFENQIM